MAATYSLPARRKDQNGADVRRWRTDGWIHENSGFNIFVSELRVSILWFPQNHAAIVVSKESKTSERKVVQRERTCPPWGCRVVLACGQVVHPESCAVGKALMLNQKCSTKRRSKCFAVTAVSGCCSDFAKLAHASLSEHIKEPGWYWDRGQPLEWGA